MESQFPFRVRGIPLSGLELHGKSRPSAGLAGRVGMQSGNGNEVAPHLEKPNVATTERQPQPYAAGVGAIPGSQADGMVNIEISRR